MLRYESATFIRPRLGKPGKGDLRVFAGNDQASIEGQFNVAVLTQLHEVDWSGEVTSPDGRLEAAEITKAVSRGLRDLNSRRVEAGIQSNIEDDLVSIFQTANAQALELRVVGSLLTVFWTDRSLYIASIGGCCACLIRDENCRQLVEDDYLRIEVNGADTATSFLRKAIGSLTVQGIADIHFTKCDIEAGDIVLMYNPTFNKQVGKPKIIETKARFPELQEFVFALGGEAVKNANALDEVLLYAVKFE